MKEICNYCLMEMIPIKLSVMVSSSDPDDAVIKIQRGDIYECPECGIETITQIGDPYERKSSLIKDLSEIKFIRDE